MLRPRLKNCYRRNAGAFGRLKRRHFSGIAEKSVERGNHLCPLADRAAHPFDRSGAHIAHSEHARHRSFQRRHQPALVLVGLRAGHYETRAIERDAATVQPTGGGVGACKQEQIADLDAALFARQATAPAHAVLNTSSIFGVASMRSIR